MSAGAQRQSQQFPIFKTITLGKYKTPDQYRAVLEVEGFLVGYWGLDILSKIEFAERESELDLVTVSLAELGYAEPVPYEQVYSRAIGLGLAVCPAEVGPALLLVATKPPEIWLPNKELRIAMKPIVSEGFASIFALDDFRAAGRLLGAYGRQDLLCKGDYRFVFVQPQ